MKTPASNSRPSPARLAWLDGLKGVAIIWLFLNHLSEHLFGGPLVANPTTNWGTIQERIAQLKPLARGALVDVLLDLLRYVGWVGDVAGVQLFILTSGFGLAWSYAHRSASEDPSWLSFYKKRLVRIYPEWITAHVLFALAGGIGLLAAAPSFVQKSFWLSLLGIRVTPGLMYAFSPAWWFFGLLVQMYLVFPLLLAFLRKAGPLRMLVVCCALGFGLRLFGLLQFQSYLDAWSRGAVVISQLPTFALGVALAFGFAKKSWSPQGVIRWLVPLAGGATLLLGYALCLSLAGMTVGPFIVGVGALALVFPPLAGRSEANGPTKKAVAWLGQHSLSIFLVHHIAIQRVVPALGVSGGRLFVRVVLSLVLSIIGALLLESVAKFGQTVRSRLRQRLGATRANVYQVACVIAIGLGLIGAEVLVRKLDPQEVMGWGELQSLQRSAEFGWNLKPSAKTRLRWLSYDYVVTSNSLGFPAPEYPEQKAPNVMRILVTGDAFSSAEGVDTEQSWPRILERNLSERTVGKKAEVLNFAITGYGPVQDEAVVAHFVGRYHPDVVLVEMFINDFEDEKLGGHIVDQIGLNNPNSQVSLKSVLQLAHLGSWASHRMTQLKQSLSGKLMPVGLFFSGLTWLQQDSPTFDPDIQARVQDRVGRMKQLAEQQGAQLVVAAVPAAIQVCSLNELPYLAHATGSLPTYNPNGPQDVMREICGRSGVEFVDLRTALKHSPCVYQPHNLHLLPLGHQLIAEHMARFLEQRRPRQAAQ